MGRARKGWQLVPGRRPDDPFYLRFTHEGQRRYLSTGERNRAEASKRAADIYAQVVHGRVHAPGVRPADASLKSLAKSYLEFIKDTGSAERHAMQEQHMNAHLLRNFRSLEELTSEACWAEYEAMRCRKGMATRTIAKELSTFRTFAKWLRQRKLIDAVPEYKGPRVRSDFQALCLEPEQIEAILQALPEKVRYGPAWGQPIRSRFVFAWETSLRPATIARICAEDYDRKLKRIRIRESADKARFGRELPLSERAWKALEGTGVTSGPFFGKAKLRITLKTAARASGLPPEISERVTPYTFRHSRITQLASVTTDLRGLAYLAGHKDLTTTSHYIHGDVKAGERVLAAAASAEASRRRERGRKRCTKPRRERPPRRLFGQWWQPPKSVPGWPRP